MNGQRQSGDIGERIVAAELEARGWAVSLPRVNQPNYDLIAEKSFGPVYVQVKTSSEKQRLDWIAAGKCTEGILYNGRPMLNSVEAERPCDVVVCVTYLLADPRRYQCWVFPKDEAEEIFRRQAIAYYSQRKRDGSARKPGPVFIKAEGQAQQNVPDDRFLISSFKDAWDILDEVNHQQHG